MTNRYQEFFKDNPWEGIDVGSYPSSARRLYKEDARFWVSVNAEGNFLFFVEENGSFDFDIVNRLDCLGIHLDQISDKTRLVCILTDAEMFDKFRTIAKDVAAYSSECSGLNLFRSVISRIYSWSEFLKPSRTGLGFRELIGFWGELFIFHSHFVESFGLENALKSWIGPENKKQDFTFDNAAFEIKTSIVGDNNDLKISSIEQLQKVTNSLYLIALRINESIELSGLTVADLVDRCISSIEGNYALKSDFLHKISEKYGKANDTELARKFIDITMTAYEVSDDFPRIVPENLPHEKILKAKYTIDGNSLEKYKTSKTLRDIVEHGTATTV
ncbi:PD-(D/E)XK motif protein [Shewanella sp. SM34]|uniref:PD-(D/E)XK motif protein n=1 Tax=unclassified Shewanella TaxID=196818 RepID=UPI0021D984A4|nr:MULTISPECIES: PD-(D/E)XK motif protein [unclassified Shewanella]MCU8058825.1 PD-(D/E)XK motif protein [Shewanella sp. SM35]MCU8067756.1 PD-(D/E)XK motif protein [Shewanella sp. SM34]